MTSPPFSPTPFPSEPTALPLARVERYALAPMLAHATNHNQSSERQGQKTRVRGSTHLSEIRGGASAERSIESHRRNSRRRGEVAVGSRKYLSPEPLLQSPEWVKSRAMEGRSVPTYAYASNNPINRTDPDGRHDTNGCQNGGSCETCAQKAGSITSETLRNCVIKQCLSQSTKLRCDPESKQKAECGPVSDDLKGGATPKGGSAGKPVKTVLWCEVPLSDECQTRLLVHELAHSCGWKEGGGHGVPDGADLTGCHPMSPDHDQ